MQVGPIFKNPQWVDLKKKETKIWGMILKFWSWCDISVTSDATCLKIVPHNNIFFVYTPCSDMYYVTWRSDRKSIPNSHALNALAYQADGACCRHQNLYKSSISISFLWLLNAHSSASMSENMANLPYILGFIGPLMYGYATVIKLWTTWNYDRLLLSKQQLY